MDISSLSPSKLETSRLCEARLAGRLNQLGEAEWDEEHGEAASTGTLAHAAAKHWYRPCPRWIERMRTGENPDILAKQAEEVRHCAKETVVPAAPEATAAQKAAWEEQVREAVNHADEQIFEQGLLKHPYSNPGHCFRKAIDEVSRSEVVPGKVENELPRDAASVSEARDLFETITNHYNRNQLNIVFAERRYKGKLANNVPVHLIIDLGIDRGNGRLELVDYKTGWISISTDDMYSKDQVLMNMLAVSRYDDSLSYFPHKSFSYFWVRQGFETGPVSFTAERLIDYEHYLAVMYQHLLNVKNPKESINRFCGSCPRRLGACAKYREHVGEAMGLFSPVAAEEMKVLDTEQLMERYDRLNGQMKILETSKKNIGEVIKSKLEVLPNRQFVGEKHKATIRQNKANDYDPATVLSLCVINGVDAAGVVDVSKKRVEATFGNIPDAMRVLQGTMRRSATKPWVDVRALGGKQDAKAVEDQASAMA